jgi:integrase/recombinase XerC/integrase/recombinase XerD
MNTNKSINELISDFLAEHQGTLSTKKKYRENLEVFVRWVTINVTDVRNIKLPELTIYKEWLITSGRSPATVVAYIVSVRQFFKYLYDEGIHDDVARKLKAYNKDRSFRRKPLKPEQATQLLTSIDQSTIIGKRDFAIINLMLRTGLRSVEVTRLDMGDFEKNGSSWQMRVQRKGQLNKNDTQGITSKTMDPLLAYFNERDQDNNEPAFINYSRASNKDDLRMHPKTISRIVKERLMAIGLNDPLLTAHSLRHTTACTAIQQGTDIFLVKALMCHKDIKTTMIYVGILESEVKLEGIAGKNIDKAY